MASRCAELLLRPLPAHSAARSHRCLPSGIRRLSSRLCEPARSQEWTGRADKLRAADRALEKLVELSSVQPITIGGGAGSAEGTPTEERVLTKEELLFQQVRVAAAVGVLLASGPGDAGFAAPP